MGPGSFGWVLETMFLTSKQHSNCRSALQVHCFSFFCGEVSFRMSLDVRESLSPFLVHGGRTENPAQGNVEGLAAPRIPGHR